MSEKNFSRLLFALLLIGTYYPLSLSFSKTNAQSTSAFSIITPYYGNQEIRSYFDHGSPDFTEDNAFIKYTGEKWDGSVDIDHCDDFTNCYDGHDGLDVDIDYDQVLAAASGTVTAADYDVDNCHHGIGCDLGLHVVITHEVNGEIYRTRYGHLSTIAVHLGQSVNSGQIIGTSGSTGASGGPHLHFAVWKCINTFCEAREDFAAIDPFGWQPIEGAAVEDDPWASGASGAESWCMWGDGEFINVCYPDRPSNPIPQPIHGTEYIVEDSSQAFSKGFRNYHDEGFSTITCVGVDPTCKEWWEHTYNYHTYFTISNGYNGETRLIDNWASWKPQIGPGDYEIFVYVPSIINSYSNDTFTWQAHFNVVDYYGKNKPFMVDQHIGAGTSYNPRDKWLSLGIHTLGAGSSVYLYDDGEAFGHCDNGPLYNGQPRCRIAADKVKFVKINYKYQVPLIRKDNTPTPTITPSPTRTNTPTRTLIPTRTATPTRTVTPITPGDPDTPTPNPYEECEPCEMVEDWGTPSSNSCNLTSTAKGYYLYPVNGVDWDADVFRYDISLKPSDDPVTITFHLQSIPPGYRYRFGVYDENKYLLGVAGPITYGQRSFSVDLDPRTDYGTNTFYIRVYSEDQGWGLPAYNAYDTYEVRATVATNYLIGGYPPPEQ